MIRIFTESKNEYEEMINMINGRQESKNETNYDIIINPPRDSFAVVAWSVDDIVQVLDEEDIDTDKISDEIFIEVIEELGIDKSIHDSTVTAGNEMIAWETGAINELIKNKMNELIIGNSELVVKNQQV